MGADDGTSVGEGFWVTPAGCDTRHSDGSGGEAAIIFTMLHHFGWIDVGLQPHKAVVRLNPSTVETPALEALIPALEERAPERKIELVLVDCDAQPVDLAFLDSSDANAYVESVIRKRAVGDETGQSYWGEEAFPLPLPQPLSDAIHFPPTAPALRRVEERDHIDEERFARSLAKAEWLAPLNTADSLFERRLTDQTPEMVTFALRTLGWVGIGRNWRLHGQPLRSTVPEIVALDPAAIRREALHQLVALSDAWTPLSGEVTLAWWDGSTWIRQRGVAAEMADRLRTLCRIAANDEPLSLVESVEVPIHQLLASGSRWSASHPFAVTLKRWQDEQTNAGAGDAILRDLERMGLFQERTKLLVIDENEDMRIARYAPGTVQVWDERVHRSMEGSRLIDVPDRGLGLRVQRDLQTVRRRRQPALHRCSGVVQGSDGMQAVQWSRLTVPLFTRVDGRERVRALLSTCALEHAVPI